MGGSRGEWRRAGGKHLQCGHVVEGQVQLLAQGLALQLLSVHFIWRSTEKHAKWKRLQEKDRKATGKCDLNPDAEKLGNVPSEMNRTKV